jgi:hypothetical protein
MFRHIWPLPSGKPGEGRKLPCDPICALVDPRVTGRCPCVSLVCCHVCRLSFVLSEVPASTLKQLREDVNDKRVGSFENCRQFGDILHISFRCVYTCDEGKERIVRLGKFL